jgi:hypothetical protein
VVLKGVGGEDEVGLFAARPMPAGTIVGKYKGYVLGPERKSSVEKEAKALEDAGTGAYLLTMGDIVVDGRRPPQSDEQQQAVARRVLFPAAEQDYPGPRVHLMNDAYRTGYENNVIVNSIGYAVTSVFVPTFDPAASHEANALSKLLSDYGTRFWQVLDE